jgi:uncharacterized protein (DUF2132 family)
MAMAEGYGFKWLTTRVIIECFLLVLSVKGNVNLKQSPYRPIGFQEFKTAYVQAIGT